MATEDSGSRSIVPKIQLRALELGDFAKLHAALEETYAGTGIDVWRREAIERVIKDFPEGQICILVDGEVAGAALALIVNYQDYGDEHTYRQITANSQLSTHNPKGDTLYGVEVFIHPKYRGMRLGRRLYDARKALCEELNLRSIVVGGRIPGYKKYAAAMSPKQYIEEVARKEIFDPILTFQLSNQFHVKKILKGYLQGDQESLEFATLLEWNNVYYEEKKTLFSRPKSYVRVGLVQWEMRRADAIDEFAEQIEFFVDAVSSFQADFVLFPEFINAPLMKQFNDLAESQAIRKLAEYTEGLVGRYTQLAISYNTNIITGSMPLFDNGKLYGVCYLCRRDGTTDSYRKIQISPGEALHWGMVGGDDLRIMETDSGRIGILISDDIEYPELARLYADKGAEILFVPFSTPTQNDFQRIKVCAQARAIENECYVAIAGCVGNLPTVSNMDIQFAQSAVFSPSDFAFPTDSTIAEATPNTEMTVLADCNLDLLKEVHRLGSSRNLLDRRNDLYQVIWKKDFPPTSAGGA
jgi:predicted amidohydrolase/GNAT superfamily N-acetyltransferase